jgi:hypothetical protein
VYVETKEQSKQWMHTHSPNKPNVFKQKLSACQKADGNCFLGQGRSADSGIPATRDSNNFTSVLLMAIENKRRGIIALLLLYTV